MPRYITADGTGLNFRSAGAGRPAVILIHGWSSNLKHWAPTARHLARKHCVLSVDLRGHGRSAAPPDGYSIAGFADDIAALARAQRVRGAIVVGHSMGGLVTLELARREPALVKALVLVESPLARHATTPALARSPLWKLVADADGSTGVARLYERFFPADAPPHIRALGRRVVADGARTPRHAALGAWCASLTADVPAIARGVTQPVLYVNSSRLERSADEVRSVLPHAQFAQVVDSGHFVQLEVPEQLNAMLDAFLKSV